MERGLRRLVWRKHVWFHGQTAYDGAEIGTGLTQALLCLNSWPGYGKRVAGKSLDLTVTLFIGVRIWGYSRDTSYVPCRDVRTGVMTGTLNLFGHIR